mmetsp:Transcript_4404/g.7997  ORF Transcript_4404/g.7997 Transcript_4404/m.7997 type:complete len:305 (+) Transcript_4404:511-1425(+)
MTRLHLEVRDDVFEIVELHDLGLTLRHDRQGSAHEHLAVVLRQHHVDDAARKSGWEGAGKGGEEPLACIQHGRDPVFLQVLGNRGVELDQQLFKKGEIELEALQTGEVKVAQVRAVAVHERTESLKRRLLWEVHQQDTRNKRHPLTVSNLQVMQGISLQHIEQRGLPHVLKPKLRVLREGAVDVPRDDLVHVLLPHTDLQQRAVPTFLRNRGRDGPLNLPHRAQQPSQLPPQLLVLLRRQAVAEGRAAVRRWPRPLLPSGVCPVRHHLPLAEKRVAHILPAQGVRGGGDAVHGVVAPDAGVTAM